MKLAEKLLHIRESSLRDHLKKLYKVDDSAFEKASDSHNSKSIVKTKEGYAGFSHRATCEFKIGDKLFDPDWDGDGEFSEDEIEKMQYTQRGDKVIKTMEQAREAACNFARYVS